MTGPEKSCSTNKLICSNNLIEKFVYWLITHISIHKLLTFFLLMFYEKKSQKWIKKRTYFLIKEAKQNPGNKHKNNKYLKNKWWSGYRDLGLYYTL